MIKRVEFRNFKSLWDVDLTLGRLTVLVGTNGAGKSSILQAIFLARRAEEVPEEAWPLATDPDEITHVRLEASEDLVLEWAVDWDAEPPSMTRTLGTPRGDWDADTRLPLKGSRVSAADWDDEELDMFFPAVMHAVGDTMRMPSAAVKEQPDLDSDGEGLATFLAWMAAAHPDAYAAVSRDLAAVVPGVQGVRIFPTEVDRTEWESRFEGGKRIRERVTETIPGHRLSILFDDGRLVRSQVISDGTLVALAVLARVHAPHSARILLIDDIDQGLHIAAQSELVRALRTILDRNPDLQIVCTSQSPYLLDSIDPAEVRVLALDSDRHTHVRPLTDHPRFEEVRFGTQTGELWATLGESWVLDPPAGR